MRKKRIWEICLILEKIIGPCWGAEDPISIAQKEKGTQTQTELIDEVAVAPRLASLFVNHSSSSSSHFLFRHSQHNGASSSSSLLSATHQFVMVLEALAAASATSSSASPPSTSNSNLPPPPQDAWTLASQRLLPRWKSLSHSHLLPIPISISKVNQVDAARLDIEMSAMLKEQLVKVFALMKPGMLFQYEAELDAFLEFLIWRFSIWVDKPTPGIALMNLRYRDERAMEIPGKVRTGLEGPGLTVAQKIWYCVASVGGQYLWTRLQSFSAFRRWGDSEQRSLARRAWLLIQRIEGIYKAAAFGNLLIFLYTGRYRNLVERVLRARLVYGSPNMNRAVSFEYMNRQLVWNEFSEMLLLLLPLLNSSSVRNFLRPFSKEKSTSSAEDDSACPICLASPTIPFLALPCQHRYCYYCLRTRCMASQSFRCSRCSEPVVAMQRHIEGTTTNPKR